MSEWIFMGLKKARKRADAREFQFRNGVMSDWIFAVLKTAPNRADVTFKLQNAVTHANTYGVVFKFFRDPAFSLHDRVALHCVVACLAAFLPPTQIDRTASERLP
jgi:hypothetical protein